MNTLVIEILACLFAAAFLSLFIGWAIRSVLANKESKAATAAWESKHSELELRYKQDTEHLEEQVERLDLERQQLGTQNKNISDSLRENEIGVHKARADAIELNRQQADTQERLQRIISQKDEELKMIRNGSAPTINASGIAGTPAMDDGTTEAKIATLSAKREAWELERQRLVNNIGDNQQTVAIDPADLPSESFDRTVRVQPEYVDELRRKVTQSQEHEFESDKTLILDEDQTIALDDNNLNRTGINRPTHGKPSPGGAPKKGFPGDYDD